MTEYIVYRTGPEQPGGADERRPVARLSARSADEACEKARKSVTLSGGQRLSAEPAEKVDAKEADLNRRGAALPKLIPNP
jgi:hypothetical protein